MNQDTAIARKKGFRYKFARLHKLIRIEGDTPVKKALAVGLGSFIGFTPLYGLHLAICLGVAHLLKLNKMLTYLATYANNPFITPLVIYLEFGVGRMLLQGQWPNISFSHFRVDNLLQTGLEIFLGSLLIGSFVGISLGVTTYLATRNQRLSPFKAEIIELTADNYLPTGILNWEFVRGKLNYDPVYFYLLKNGLLTESRCIWDLGCGRGILLNLVATATAMAVADNWHPDWKMPPTANLNGIEKNGTAANVAQMALEGKAKIITASVIEFVPYVYANKNSDTFLLIDVLMYLSEQEQAKLLEKLKAVLPVAGKIIVREADMGLSWRHLATNWAEKFRAILRGHVFQKCHYRSAEQWTALFQQGGFHVERLPMSEGTPFSNQLYLITHQAQ